MKVLIKNCQRKFEKMYVRIMKWRHIPGSARKLIFIDIKKYRGKRVQLGNTTINQGDTVAEIHIDNINAENIDNSLRNILRRYNEEFSYLSKACYTDKDFKDIKAIYGITILHPFLKRMGFICMPINNAFFRNYLRFWENMLKNSFSKNGRKNKRNKNEPMKCWMSVEELKRKYPETFSI